MQRVKNRCAFYISFVIIGTKYSRKEIVIFWSIPPSLFSFLFFFYYTRFIINVPADIISSFSFLPSLYASLPSLYLSIYLISPFLLFLIIVGRHNKGVLFMLSAFKRRSRTGSACIDLSLYNDYTNRK